MKNRIGNWIWILLLFTLALILRLVLLRYRHCIETDGVAYVAIARDLIQHGTLSETSFPPFYPALLGLTSLLVGDYELSGRMVSAIAGSLLVIPVFLLGERLYSRRIGYLAATLVVFYPALVEFSTYVLTESFYVFLFSCFVLATLVAFKNHRWPFFALSGVLLGLSYLIRPEALGYLPYLLLVYVGTCLITVHGFRVQGSRVQSSSCFAATLLRPKDIRKTTVFINATAFAAGALCLMIPYMVFVGGISGKTETNLRFGDAVDRCDFNRAIDEAGEQKDTAQPLSLVSELLQHPCKMSKRWIMNLHLVHKYAFPNLFPPLILCLAAVGLSRIKGRWEEIFLLLLWAPYVTVLFFFVDARLFLALVPTVLIFGARGIELIQNAISSRLSHVRSWVTEFAVLILALAALLPYTLRPLYRPDENVTYRDAGLWLSCHAQPPLRIIDRRHCVAFYAGGERLYLPIGEWPQVLQYAKTCGATHLVVDDRTIPEARPELLLLLFPDSAPTDLRLAGEFSAPGAVRVLIYEFR